MVRFFFLFFIFMALIGCTDSPNALGSKALRELSKSELELSPSIIAVDNVSIDVDNCRSVDSNLNTKHYLVTGIIHNTGKSMEDVPMRSIARGDRIRIDIHVKSEFAVSNTGKINISYFNKEYSVEKL